MSAPHVARVARIARLSPNWLLAKLAAIYVEVFRNIPLLVQILFWYFASRQFFLFLLQQVVSMPLAPMAPASTTRFRDAQHPFESF